MRATSLGQPTGRPAKWAFQYLVQGSKAARSVVETFDHADFANRYAVAVHGRVWAIEQVADYTSQTVTTKMGQTPIASY